MRPAIVTAFAILVLASTVLPAEAQWRGRGGGGWHHGGDSWGNNRGSGFGNFGGAVLGGVIGGVIGGAFAQPRPYYAPQPQYAPVYDNDAVRYCMQRFRSYDPRTGVYLGFDGNYHRCPREW